VKLILALLTILAAQSAEAVAEPPIQIAVEGVSAERTIAEFMDVCLRPRWDVASVKKAVESSEFAYKEEPNDNSPNAFGWKSKRAYLSLTFVPDFSQCALSIGSVQPRTGRQMQAKLKPAVEAE
jgi:hypothetical protein